MNTKSNFLLLISCLTIGLVLTIFFLGYENIGLTKTNWIIKYDTISDFLALKFFLNDQWHFPLGLNSNYGDLTNSIVFSGAVPLFSIISKIFKNFLPYNFHFFPIWIGFCFALQIFFSYKIIFNFTKDNIYSLISSFFFIFTPILIYRLGFHLSLGAHWLILAYILLEMSNNKKNVLFYKIILVTISSLIHFYFTIMLLLMNLFFSFYRYLEFKNLKILIKENVFILIPLVLTMYLVGYFVIPPTDTLGFGYGFYKANLLTFFDPSDSTLVGTWSLFLPDISNVKGEFEGFGYLGFGIIILSFFLIIYIFKNFIPNIKLNIKYILLSTIFLLLAFTNSINIGNFELINLKLPLFMYAPLSVIRASGRFIWPIYYLIIIFSLIAFYKLKIKFRYLLLLLIIQLIDLSPGIKNNFDYNKFINENKKLDNLVLREISQDYNTIISTYPSDSSNAFSTASSLLIKKKFDKTNIFRLGRYNRQQISKQRSKLYLELNESKLDSRTIYIVENIDHLRHLNFLFKDTNHGFFNLNNIWAILPNKKSKMLDKDLKKLNLTNYKKIKVNQKINISTKDTNGILGLGWSHASYGRNVSNLGAWSEGYKSSLIFEVSDSDQFNYASITVGRVLIEKDQTLLADIYLNNEYLKSLSLENFKDQEILIDFSQKGFKKGINLIDFKIKNPITPVSKLESVDGRLLGFLFKDIEFN
tara:strand:- start:627 stop:2729 length:2103 start_codon:yes stop_codon:yes gene_type:complete